MKITITMEDQTEDAPLKISAEVDDNGVKDVQEESMAFIYGTLAQRFFTVIASEHGHELGRLTCELYNGIKNGNIEEIEANQEVFDGTPSIPRTTH
jgi:hypothetical protein